MAELKQDIDSMGLGLFSWCTTGGSNLSTGQKARLSLARIFYKKRNLVLLDDPLKSIDQKLSKKILMNISRLQSTRIMTTNDLDISKLADRIIILENGKIKYNGPYNQEYIDTNFIFKDESFLLLKNDFTELEDYNDNKSDQSSNSFQEP